MAQLRAGLGVASLALEPRPGDMAVRRSREWDWLFGSWCWPAQGAFSF